MTRTISLADDAYEDLARQKRPGESFSDVARRLARESRQRALFDRSLRWDLDDEAAEGLAAAVRDARDGAASARFSL
ncbi:MAG: antitoxin VapB family protein [Thermoplasmatota archaeon]